MTPSAPRISVIIAAYNAEATIAEALTSLMIQTVHDFEIVVVDDGSKDATAEIVRDFPSGDIPLHLVSQTNAGPSAARNHGITEARAELIAFMDADDLSLPWRFSHQLRLVDAYPEAGAILCEVAKSDAEAKREPPFDLAKVEHLTLTDFAGNDNLGGTGSSITRRDALLAVGGFDARLWNGEDFDLWTRVITRYPMVRYTNPVLRIRHAAGSLSSDFERCLPQVTALMFKVFGEGGVFAEHREYAPVLKAHQYDHLSWMAFREGKRLAALRLLGASAYQTLLGRLRLPKARYPKDHLPLLARYLIGKPPETGEV